MIEFIIGLIVFGFIALVVGIETGTLFLIGMGLVCGALIALCCWAEYKVEHEYIGKHFA